MWEWGLQRSSMMMTLTAWRRAYFAGFFLVAPKGLHMLLKPEEYNSSMDSVASKFMKLQKKWDVDALPHRLRLKLAGDIVALASGIIAAEFLCLPGIDVAVTAVTAFDIMGSLTSAIVALQGHAQDWVPAVSHGMFALWGCCLLTASRLAAHQMVKAD